MIDERLVWMLDDTLQTPGALHAILLSGDGLLRAHSTGMDTDEAERQAAAISAAVSISRNAAGFCGLGDSPGWQQTLIEFARGYVLVIAAGQGSYLAVAAGAGVDLEACSYRMHKAVDRLGREMGSPPRQTGARS